MVSVGGGRGCRETGYKQGGSRVLGDRGVLGRVSRRADGRVIVSLSIFCECDRPLIIFTVLPTADYAICCARRVSADGGVWSGCSRVCLNIHLLTVWRHRGHDM